jgi:hypothetical protein
MTYNIARFTPNFYVTDSLMRIFHGGVVFDQAIWRNVGILFAICVAAAAAGVQLFKRTEFR